MKIQLVNPPVSTRYSRCTRCGCFPPLDMLSLGSFVQLRHPQVEVEILDGDVLTLDAVLRRLDADVIGISPKVFSYETALEIAEAAKGIGATVVLGGGWASAMPSLILRNRPFVDAVVLGDGEAGLAALVSGTPPHEVPNLAYRDGGRVICTPRQCADLDDLPKIRYDLVDLAPYLAAYRARFPDHPFTRPLPYFSQKGCHWYDTSGGCVFCAGHGGRNRRRSSSRFWDDVRDMTVLWQADLVWDVSDTFTSPAEWVYEICESKPADVDCSFYLYGRASDLDERMVPTLSRLGCFELLIGVESGNDALLARANKGMSRKAIVEGVRRCADYGIQVFPTFLLGLPGETKDSICDTLALAEELVGFGNIREISCAILIPLPGSRVFSALCAQLGSPAWLTESDSLDLSRVQVAYISEFVRVDQPWLMAAAESMSVLVPAEYRSSFGMICPDT